MQWQGRRGSSNIDDRRASGGGGMLTGKGCGLTGGMGTIVVVYKGLSKF